MAELIKHPLARFGLRAGTSARTVARSRSKRIALPRCVRSADIEDLEALGQLTRAGRLIVHAAAMASDNRRAGYQALIFAAAALTFSQPADLMPWSGRAGAEDPRKSDFPNWQGLP